MNQQALGRALVAAAILLLLGCTSNAADGGNSSVTPGTSQAPLSIDVDALLKKYGFVLCESPIPNNDLSDERRHEIYDEMVSQDLGAGGALDPGYRVQLELYVLDEPTLSSLAGFASPAEVCVSGGDPNNFVPLGPQALTGQGWRWVGAGSYEPPSTLGLIVDQATYDQLWQHLGEGPETSQPAIDFDHELILTIRHGAGVNFGRCGFRFDGFDVEGDTVIIRLFQPGGETACPLDYRATTYAVALDRLSIPGPPYVFAMRGGPAEEPSTAQALSDTQGRPIEANDPPQGSTSTIAVTTSAPS